MKGYYVIEVRDRNGKLRRRFRRKSHSYVQQWNELICVQVGYKLNLSIKDTGGTDRDVDKNLTTLQSNAPAANADYGIVVGTGNTAVTISDYALETICAEGTGTNQLNYQACTIADASVSGSECSFTVTRSAINNSGITITVKEIGLYCLGHDGIAGRYFLGLRDVLASTVDVPDGGAITVVYTIKVSV